ncbi:unnamed protein product [Allacma fusca]|uniref:Uncharacterized protein n=1 Tax=Allacma fusca TaxID=39272 RepID=A0A8J2K0J0_9HEXA|nr:unnamed protein product [Allacma fusca]
MLSLGCYGGSQVPLLIGATLLLLSSSARTVLCEDLTGTLSDEDIYQIIDLATTGHKLERKPEIYYAAAPSRSPFQSIKAVNTFESSQAPRELSRTLFRNGPRNDNTRHQNKLPKPNDKKSGLEIVGSLELPSEHSKYVQDPSGRFVRILQQTKPELIDGTEKARVSSVRTSGGHSEATQMVEETIHSGVVAHQIMNQNQLGGGPRKHNFLVKNNGPVTSYQQGGGQLLPQFLHSVPAPAPPLQRFSFPHVVPSPVAPAPAFTLTAGNGNHGGHIGQLQVQASPLNQPATFALSGQQPQVQHPMTQQNNHQMVHLNAVHAALEKARAGSDNEGLKEIGQIGVPIQNVQLPQQFVQPLHYGPPPLENQPGLQVQSVTPNQVVLQNQGLLQNQPVLQNPQVLHNQQALQNQQAIQNQQALQNQQAIQNQQALQNQQAIQNQQALQNQEALQNQVLQNQQVLHSQQLLHNEQVLMNQQLLQNQQDLQNQQILQNQQNLHNQQALQNQQNLHNQQALQNQQAFQNQQALQNQHEPHGQNQHVLQTQPLLQNQQLPQQQQPQHQLQQAPIQTQLQQPFLTFRLEHPQPDLPVHHHQLHPNPTLANAANHQQQSQHLQTQAIHHAQAVQQVEAVHQAQTQNAHLTQTFNAHQAQAQNIHQNPNVQTLHALQAQAQSQNAHSHSQQQTRITQHVQNTQQQSRQNTPETQNNPHESQNNGYDPQNNFHVAQKNPQQQQQQQFQVLHHQTQVIHESQPIDVQPLVQAEPGSNLIPFYPHTQGPQSELISNQPQLLNVNNENGPSNSAQLQEDSEIINSDPSIPLVLNEEGSPAELTSEEEALILQAHQHQPEVQIRHLNGEPVVTIKTRRIITRPVKSKTSPNAPAEMKKSVVTTRVVAHFKDPKDKKNKIRAKKRIIPTFSSSHGDLQASN